MMKVMIMKKNTPPNTEAKTEITFDPIVPCQWWDNKEVKSSEWLKMVTRFLKTFNLEK